MLNEGRLVKNPVILVDDSADDIEIARQVYKLTKLENEFLVMREGDQLLSYLDGINLGVNKMPTLVLIDLNMPGKNGFEVLSQVRTKPEFKEFPKIIMFSHSNLKKDKEKSIALGANGFKSKPIELNDYINLLKAQVTDN